MTAPLEASAAAWRHYVPALNIFFALLESELHCHGRGLYIYWAEPIGRTDVIRVHYPNDGSDPGIGTFGPLTEMALQRFAGELSVGARMDGMYYQDVIGAFDDACVLFEKAHDNPDLWQFLERYASAWTAHQLEQPNSSLVLSWSLIERDLVRQTDELLQSVPKGYLQQLNRAGTHVQLGKTKENELRTRIASGESPMAGVMIAVLEAHSQRLPPTLKSVKVARDALTHQGVDVSFQSSAQALELCSEIATKEFGIELKCRSGPNPHLGLTPR